MTTNKLQPPEIRLTIRSKPMAKHKSKAHMMPEKAKSMGMPNKMPVHQDNPGMVVGAKKGKKK